MLLFLITSLFNLERDFFIYSTHWINGLYLVDQVNGFTIPDTANQLNELSTIIGVMLELKVFFIFLIIAYINYSFN